MDGNIVLIVYGTVTVDPFDEPRDRPIRNIGNNLGHLFGEASGPENQKQVGLDSHGLAVPWPRIMGHSTEWVTIATHHDVRGFVLC